ncbi:MAG: GEVED domain-containing protein [Pirellulaceae bacterium]
MHPFSMLTPTELMTLELLVCTMTLSAEFPSAAGLIVGGGGFAVATAATAGGIFYLGFITVGNTLGVTPFSAFVAGGVAAFGGAVSTSLVVAGLFAVVYVSVYIQVSLILNLAQGDSFDEAIRDTLGSTDTSYGPSIGILLSGTNPPPDDADDPPTGAVGGVDGATGVAGRGEGAGIYGDDTSFSRTIVTTNSARSRIRSFEETSVCVAGCGTPIQYFETVRQVSEVVTDAIAADADVTNVVSDGTNFVGVVEDRNEWHADDRIEFESNSGVLTAFDGAGGSTVVNNPTTDDVASNIRFAGTLLSENGLPPTLALLPTSPAFKAVAISGSDTSQNGFVWTDVADIGAWGGLHSDSDGVPDVIEDAAPNGGNGNNDSTADHSQDDVVSLPISTGSYVTLATNNQEPIRNLTTNSASTFGPLPQSAVPSFGALGFDVAEVTNSTSVTLLIDDDEPVESYFNYGATADNPEPHWYEFLFDGTTGAEIFADHIVVHYVDGQRGDHDLTADGVIQTLGAPTTLNDLVVIETDDTTVVSDAGTSDTFSVRLNRQPASDVVVRIDKGDADFLMLDQSELTFTPDNFDTPQIVTISGNTESTPVVDLDELVELRVSIDDHASDASFSRVGDVLVNTIYENTQSATLTVDDAEATEDEGVVTTDVHLSGPIDIDTTYTVSLNGGFSTDVTFAAGTSGTRSVSIPFVANNTVNPHRSFLLGSRPKTDLGERTVDTSATAIAVIYDDDGFDFGDAPASYGTLLVDDGARHGVGGPILGQRKDRESDGLVSADALGDDTSGYDVDDEDGITFVNSVVAGDQSQINALVGGTGGTPPYLSAWADLDGDGTFDQVGERILNNVLVSEGANEIAWEVPSDTASGNMITRFRISHVQPANPSPIGFVPGGEVEDYAVNVLPAPPRSVQLEVSSTTGSEQDQSIIIVTAKADRPVIGDQTVDVLVSGDNIDASDFTLSSTQIQIADGQTEGSVTFSVVDDSAEEAVETATLTLANPSSGIEIDMATRTITIESDDEPEITFNQLLDERVWLDVENVTPEGITVFVWGTMPGETFLPQFGMTLGIADPTFGSLAEGGTDGTASGFVPIPFTNDGDTFLFQAFEIAPNPQVTNVVQVNIAGSPVVISDNNAAPEMTDNLPSFTATFERAFDFDVANQFFVDPDSDDPLIYTARQSDGSALPDWLTFNPSDLSFHSDNLPEAGTWSIVVTAVDRGSPVKFSSTHFELSVIADQSVWQNATDRYDTNQDGRVAPLDALIVLNHLNRTNQSALSDQRSSLERPIDVNGDRIVTPLDALQILNRLNRTIDGEAAPPPTSPSPSMVDSIDYEYTKHENLTPEHTGTSNLTVPFKPGGSKSTQPDPQDANHASEDNSDEEVSQLTLDLYARIVDQILSE